MKRIFNTTLTILSITILFSIYACQNRARNDYKDRIVIIDQELCDTIHALRYQDYDNKQSLGIYHTYFSAEPMADYILYQVIPNFGMQIYSPTSKWRDVEDVDSDFGKEYFIAEVGNIRFYYRLDDIWYGGPGWWHDNIGELRVTAEILICTYLIEQSGLWEGEMPNTFKDYLAFIVPLIDEYAEELSNEPQVNVSCAVSMYAADLINVSSTKLSC